MVGVYTIPNAANQVNNSTGEPVEAPGSEDSIIPNDCKLAGSYYNRISDTTLVIHRDKLDEYRGRFIGSVTTEGRFYDVTGTFHYKDCVGPQTVIAWTGYSGNHGYLIGIMKSQDKEFSILTGVVAKSLFGSEVVGVISEVKNGVWKRTL